MTTLRRSVGVPGKGIGARARSTVAIGGRATILALMIHDASRDRPDPHNRSDAPAGAAPPSSWLKLGLAGAIGFVAGAMLFPTPAEGDSRRSRAPTRPVRRELKQELRQKSGRASRAEPSG